MATYGLLGEKLGVVRQLPERRLRHDLTGLVDRVLDGDPAGSDLFYRCAVDNAVVTNASAELIGQRYLACFGQHCALLAQALPRPRFQAPLVVWRSSDGFGTGVDAWDHGEIIVEHVLEGGHVAPLRPPGVRRVAAQLVAFLRARRGEVPAPASARG